MIACFFYNHAASLIIFFCLCHIIVTVYFVFLYLCMASLKPYIHRILFHLITNRNPDEAVIFFVPYDVGVSALVDEQGLMRRGGGKFATSAAQQLHADIAKDPVCFHLSCCSSFILVIIAYCTLSFISGSGGAMVMIM